MKTKDLAIVGGAAIAAFFLLKRFGGANFQAQLQKTADAVNGVFNTAAPGEPGFGWRYFDDGTAIDPAGNYYFQGKLIWTSGK